MKAIESGVITKSTKSRLEKLEAEEEELVKEIEDERYNKPPLTKEMVWFVIDKYRGLDMTVEKEREKLIDGLVGRIILYGDGRLIITFNYKNEPVETTLDEIIAAATLSSDINNFGSPKTTASFLEAVVFLNSIQMTRTEERVSQKRNDRFIFRD